MTDTQKLIRRLLRTKMSDADRAEACIPLPPGITWWRALLLIMEHYGEDISMFPMELRPDE